MIIKNDLTLLYSDLDMRAVFPVTYRRGKNLKALISPSLFLQLQLATKSHTVYGN